MFTVVDLTVLKRSSSWILDPEVLNSNLIAIATYFLTRLPSHFCLYAAASCGNVIRAHRQYELRLLMNGSQGRDRSTE